MSSLKRGRSRERLGTGVACLAILAVVPALAADLPSRKTAPLVAPPLLTWTGFYIGLNAGTSAGDVSSTRSFFAPAGVGAPEFQKLNSKLPFGDFFLGAQAGYNWQMPSGVVLGVETDFALGVLRKSASADYVDIVPGFFNTVTGRARFGLDWQGSTRLRLGYAVTPRFLPYVTGGLAYAAIAGDTKWSTDAFGLGNTSMVRARA